jgi:uncharacterized membrane protein
MLDNLIYYLTLGSALGSGLIAGAFFALSTFVMRALARLPANEGLAAMQSINVTVINPWFMLVFLGTGVMCSALIVMTVLRWQKPGAGFLLAASLLYLIGTFLVTMLFNVPRNDALAAVEPGSANGVAVWASYVSSWTAWNHVRTVAAVAATVLFVIAISQRR